MNSPKPTPLAISPLLLSFHSCYLSTALSQRKRTYK